MKLKKIISAAVGATMLCASLPFSSTTIDFVKDNIITANAEDEMQSSGKCGENVYYSLSDDGVLTISGSGKMEEYGNRSPFNDNDSIKSIIIEEGVTLIGDATFSGCNNVVNITIPKSVVSIGGYAFYDTKWLENKRKENPLVIVNNILIDGETCKGNVVIPNTVKIISDYAFQSCVELTSITIPDSVTSIGGNAFSDCTSLKDIVIPNSVNSINNEVFSGCTYLENITIPETVNFVGERAFKDTKWLKNKQKENPLVIVNNILIDGTACSGDIIIPNTVTSICGYAFENCTNITTVILSDGITTIASKAFQRCEKLNNIVIPKSVDTIGDNAFRGCWALTDVYYKGTEEDWKEVNITAKNKELLAATIHFNSESVPTESTDNSETTEGSESSVNRGDVNLDGEISIADAVLLNKYLVGSATLSDMAKKNADCDADGDITSSDTLKILKYIVGSIDEIK